MTSTSPQKYVVIDGAGNSFELMDADGTPFPAYFSEDPEALLSDVKNMAARDDDVFIVAYPKAGMKRKKNRQMYNHYDYNVLFVCGLRTTFMY